LFHLVSDVLEPEPDGVHAAQATAIEPCGPSGPVPFSRDMTLATSARLMTTGTLIFVLARTIHSR
jgi:hypothetical protein